MILRLNAMARCMLRAVGHAREVLEGIDDKEEGEYMFDRDLMQFDKIDKLLLTVTPVTNLLMTVVL